MAPWDVQRYFHTQLSQRWGYVKSNNREVKNTTMLTVSVISFLSLLIFSLLPIILDYIFRAFAITFKFRPAQNCFERTWFFRFAEKTQWYSSSMQMETEIILPLLYCCYWAVRVVYYHFALFRSQEHLII